MVGNLRIHLQLVMLCLFTLAACVSSVDARGFRVSMLPNGSENNCANCHFNPGGGGSRTPFGQDVNSIVSRGGREAYWSPDLAMKDSDDDGFTNGQEVGDIDGDGVPERTVNISLPGHADDFPAMALGDCNLDTVLDRHDLACVDTIEARDAVLAELNSLPGDLDGLGGVGFPDFLTFSSNFGQDVPSYAAGNINLDGTIDFSDFLILSRNFGKTAGGSLATATVPEPSCLLMTGLACSLVSRWRRRRP